MGMTWIQPDEGEAPPFDNAASPYAHYWLSLLPGADDRWMRRAIVDQTLRLNRSTEDLVRRAFGR